MEYEKIKKLMADMEESKLTEISVEFPDGLKICIKKENKVLENVEKVLNIENVTQKNLSNEIEKDENVKIIKSPMVGTYYSKPSPTSGPYVEVGKEIKKGETICIIDSMKLMNEIESEYTGKIVEILVKDEEMLEYGTPLMKIVVSE